MRQGIPLEKVTLAILAGGEGKRMGQPKGLLRLDDQPILEYLLDRFHWPGPTLLITAPGREHPPGAKRFSAEHVDPIAGQGPLRGVLTALEHLTTDFLVITTVDMPGILPDHLNWLIAHLAPDEPGRVAPTGPKPRSLPQRKSSPFGVMTTRIVQSEHRIEPFPCALRKKAAALIANQLERGHRSMHRLLDEPGFIGVVAPEQWSAETWTNLNSPSDLNSLQ